MPMMEDDLYEQEQETKPEEKPKKKKKKSKAKLFFLLLLILAGVLGGMHLTGTWDARPLLYRTLPSLPFVGPYLGEWLQVPPEYSLTVEERRELDLEKREELLREWEEGLREREETLENLSKDLTHRENMVKTREQSLAASLEEAEKEPTEDLSQENIKRLLRVYSEMSPRNAAEIMQNLPGELAVTLLSRMPQDQAANILSKMEPPRAAFITRELANLEPPQE